MEEKIISGDEYSDGVITHVVETRYKFCGLGFLYYINDVFKNDTHFINYMIVCGYNADKTDSGTCDTVKEAKGLLNYNWVSYVEKFLKEINK